MPTTKPQKSVNLDLEDHARALRCARALDKKFAAGDIGYGLKIKATIRYALILLEKDLKDYLE